MIIDPGAAPAHAAAIAAFADSVRKPLAAVFLTHAHLDHYGALEWLDRRGAPLVTSRGVARHLGAYHDLNYARFGRPAPIPPTPTRTLGDRESLLVDGITITLHDAGPGESYADAWFLITGGARPVAVVGDLAMYGLPPFLQSGRSREWLASLAEVRSLIPSDAVLYIGHDLAGLSAAEPRTGVEILDWQAKRLAAFRRSVAALTGRTRLLTPGEVRRVVARLHADEPANLPDFDFLITTAANVLAAELIEEAQKERFEAALRTVMTQPSPRGR